MDTTMLKKLKKIADALDERGLFEEADRVDSVVRKLADNLGYDAMGILGGMLATPYAAIALKGTGPAVVANIVSAAGSVTSLTGPAAAKLFTLFNTGPGFPIAAAAATGAYAGYFLNKFWLGDKIQAWLSNFIESEAMPYRAALENVDRLIKQAAKAVEDGKFAEGAGLLTHAKDQIAVIIKQKDLSEQGRKIASQISSHIEMFDQAVGQKLGAVAVQAGNELIEYANKGGQAAGESAQKTPVSSKSAPSTQTSNAMGQIQQAINAAFGEGTVPVNSNISDPKTLQVLKAPPPSGLGIAKGTYKSWGELKSLVQKAIADRK